MKWFAYLVDLFYPRLCQACGRMLLAHERVICSYCNVQLPRTNFLEKKDNALEQIFWGRTNIKAATAYYKYTKGGKVQHLIHQLKYKGFRDVGVHVGIQLGRLLAQSSRFSDIDIIVLSIIC